MLPCLFYANTKYKYKSYQAHVNTQIQLKIISISILRLLLLLSRTHASPVDEASGNVGEQYFFSLIVYFLSSIKCISSFLLDRLFLALSSVFLLSCSMPIFCLIQRISFLHNVFIKFYVYVFCRIKCVVYFISEDIASNVFIFLLRHLMTEMRLQHFSPLSIEMIRK